MNPSPLVSIITVTYNADRTLEQTMLSVLNQTYPHIEYIVVDGLSTDGTLDIIKKYKSQLSSWTSEKDNGIYDAMNKGIGMAKGEIIGMINAGDYYEPDTIKYIVDAHLKDPGYGIFHGNINMLDEQGDFCKIKKPNPNLSELYKGMSVYHPTFFVLKSIYTKIGLYDADFKIAADFDFALRNYRQGTRFCYLDQVIANFRMGGLSQTTGNLAREESRKILYKNGYPEDIVEPLFKFWLKKDKKDRLMIRGHSLLKMILPEKLLAALSGKM